MAPYAYEDEIDMNDPYWCRSPEECEQIDLELKKQRELNPSPLRLAVKARLLETIAANKEAEEVMEIQNRIGKALEEQESAQRTSTPASPPATVPKSKKLTTEEASIISQLLDFSLVCCWDPDHMNMKSAITKPPASERIIIFKTTQPYLRHISPDPWVAAKRIARILAFCTYSAIKARDNGEVSRMNWYMPTLTNLVSNTNHFNKISVDYAVVYPEDDLDLGQWFVDIDSNRENLKQRLAALSEI
jgi:hypothetical protein